MTALWALAGAVAASWAVGRLGRRACAGLHPAVAVRMLAAASVTSALATGFTLTVAAFTTVAVLPGVATAGHWSVSVLTSHDYVPPWLGAAAAATVLVLLGLAARFVVSSAADLLTAQAACRHLGAGTKSLVILEDDAPDAYTLPGVRGRIVVTTAMLAALSGDERRALLAHEHAHLAHRHHAYIQLTELGAKANPLLGPLVPAVRDLVERWADEEAAVAAGRPTTARAIARAALAQHDSRRARARHRLALGAATSPVVQRTQALLGEPPVHRRCSAVALAALVAAAPVAATICALLTEHWFELAQSASQLR